jgi:hypothetical protein
MWGEEEDSSFFSGEGDLDSNGGLGPSKIDGECVRGY